MPRRDFYDLRLGEFFEAMDAYRREAESGREHVGNLVRTQTFRIFRLFASKKDQARLKKEEQFWPMPWDEPEEDAAEALAKMSAEDRQERLKDFLNKLDGDGSES
ncbi:MAG: hypothetical protein IKR72_01975 [Bacteroidales bacterium]|nr:hypothetical protein [Bacteroidales bacterium]